MRFMLSFAAAVLAAAPVLGSPLRSGPCPPGLSAPDSAGQHRPSGAVRCSRTPPPLRTPS
jgi:hypothetical protein